jgi:hypothetical protein
LNELDKEEKKALKELFERYRKCGEENPKLKKILRRIKQGARPFSFSRNLLFYQ